MKLDKALEKLEELFRKWGLSKDDWILIGPYAEMLQGYEREIREGHFNTILNKDKVWWETSQNETIPPKDSTDRI